jgi:hypothetical protein
MSTDEQHDHEHWKNEPDAHDYPAATEYLSLLVPPKIAKKTGRTLRRAPLTVRKAKDLLRASGLALLPADNVDVHEDLTKVRRGERLSPVLLVRGSLATGRSLVVADGYHRICASYHLDQDTDIPCHLVDLPT